MRSIVIPLNITSKGIETIDDEKKAIDQSIALLLATACYSTPADPEYGFIFNNMRFEIFDENEGVIYNSSGSTEIFEGPVGLYDKKISGSSKNINTFASELKDAIVKYEHRVENLTVMMSYIRQERRIAISIKGNIVGTEKKYEYQTYITVGIS